MAKHGYDFYDVLPAFFSPILEFPDDRFEYDEERWIGIGGLNWRIITMVYTEKPEQVIRLISVRNATKYERRIYANYIEEKE